MDDIELPLRIKQSLVFIALLSAILIGASVGTATPGIKPTPIPTSTPRPTATLTPTQAPTPVVIPTPVKLPSPTPKPTITPTPDPIIEATTKYTLDLVIPWGAAVEHFMNAPSSIYSVDYDDLTVGLVLAIMANESYGQMELVSYAGACGLMQVIPKSWFPENEHELCESPFANIRAGMRILQLAIDIAQERGEPLEYGLAYYNCSEKGVHSDGCGDMGGLNYADRVLNFWLPRVEARLDECAEKWGADFYWEGVKHWGCNH